MTATSSSAASRTTPTAADLPLVDGRGLRGEPGGRSPPPASGKRFRRSRTSLSSAASPSPPPAPSAVTAPPALNCADAFEYGASKLPRDGVGSKGSQP